MPLVGDLRTMSLADLLRWAGKDQKTGVLELERNKLCRRIEFRKGWIGACSSSDPASRLGQFLLARGKITEANLREALARQQEVRKNLGWILMEMEVLSRQELARQISAKAEETAHGLFDWDEAVFRFHQGATLDPDHIEVSLSVEDIVEKGCKRAESLRAVRRVLKSSGVVLERTGGAEKFKSLNRPMARRILESIDGQKTVAEILLHTSASEFVVLMFLHQLCEKGLAAIKEERPVEAISPTLLDPLPRRLRPVQWTEDRIPDAVATAEPAETDETAGEQIPVASDEELDAEIQVANRLVSRGEYLAALELLNAAYRSHPEDNYLRRLLSKTEESYVAASRRQDLSFHKVPVLHPEAGDVGGIVRPEESFLMSMINGKSDIQSLLWTTPLREVDVLMALRRMVDRGLIELIDPNRPEPDGEPVAAGQRDLHRI